MKQSTARLWSRQDRHPGDRRRLFATVASWIDHDASVDAVLYPGSFVDIAPSFVWPSVTYVDTDRRAAAFFDDEAGVREIIAAHPGAPSDPDVRFVHADYTAELPVPTGAFDLLISLFAGPISLSCTRYLRVGGLLLVNPSHGDAALASIDDRFELAAVVGSRSGAYSVSESDLDTYLVAKRSVDLSRDAIVASGRGIAYTRSPFAYLFRRIAPAARRGARDGAGNPPITSSG